MANHLFVTFFLFAVVIAYVTSQAGLVTTVITVAVMVIGILFWKKKRPSDFIIRNSWPRVFVSVMFAVVFAASYLIVRNFQATNYRAQGLAAICVVSILLAVYFGTVGRNKLLR